MTVRNELSVASIKKLAILWSLSNWVIGLLIHKPRSEAVTHSNANCGMQIEGGRLFICPVLLAQNASYSFDSIPSFLSPKVCS
jgi:hypothetical protein